MNFICPRCGESDERYIGYKNNVPYCRRCISFIGENATYVQNNVTENALELNYSLTKEQRRISTRITKNYIEGTSTLIKAVCGAGKTELVYGVINYALSRGHRIGFAIPRKDVVIELEDRFITKYKCICCICGKEFLSPNPNVQHCSNKCIASDPRVREKISNINLERVRNGTHQGWIKRN